MSLTERPEQSCMAFNMDGVSPTHNLCWRPRGHEGPHGNERVEWPRREEVAGDA
jgi:hypothetical protein